MTEARLENGVQAAGRDLFERARRKRLLRALRAFDPAERLVRLAGRDAFTRVRLLQFTAALPLLQDDPARVVSALGEYFSDRRVSRALRFPALLAPRLPARFVAAAVLFSVEGLVARRFFAGETLEDAMAAVRRLEKKGLDVSVDVLGERSLSREDAERYVSEYLQLFESPGIGDVSIKLTSLDPEFNPAAPARTKAAVKTQLRKVLDKARASGASVTIDMEHYAGKDLTLDVFLETLEEEPPVALSLAVQSYVRGESSADLSRIIAWAEAHPGRRPGVRLVKGANWDHEVATALAKGWTPPLFLDKAETDLAFEANVRLLLEHAGVLRPAFGTHNLRSIASVLAWADALGVDRKDFEFQFLYGMIPAEAVAAVREKGCRVRFYTPYGDLIPGLAYLVRRLLENSSNQSFLKQLSYDEASIAKLLAPPRPKALREIPHEAPGEGTPAPRDGRSLRLLKNLSAAFSRWTVAGVSQKELREATRIFDAYAERLRELSRKSLSAVESVPGEQNAYFYVPRGAGALIFEGEEPALAQFAERLAGPVAGGCRVIVSLPGEKWRGALLPLLGKAGLGPEDVEFAGARAAPRDNESLARRPDLAWISYQGPPDRAAFLRRLTLDDLEKQACVKRFVTDVTPEYALEFVTGKSVSENTLKSGFAPDLDKRGGLPGFRSLPEPELHKAAARAEMESALAGSEAAFRSRRAAITTALPGDVDRAVREARAAFPAWAGLRAEERAVILAKAAERMAADRARLAALIVREAGKNIEESLRDVGEAVDFLRYYGLDAVRLEEEGAPEGWKRRPFGVAGVISPWNFPLAIPAGMVAAALAAGNAVVFKPSEETPAIASELVRLLEEAGLPAGTLGFVPGTGEDAGRRLVEHPGVDLLAFTGSRETGFSLVRSGKPVLAEMGGKNAILVDDTADLDEAAAGVVISAFGSSGQKCSACSRVIVLRGAKKRFLERLAAKFGSMVIAAPDDPACRLGPLVGPEARAKVESYRAVASREGLKVLAERKGIDVDPAVYFDVPEDSRLAREEIFGPLLCVFTAKDFEDAVRLANSTPFALTAGLYSQSPARIEAARERLEAGNVYVNRPITGAAVNRQPFGGWGHSGTGMKAGGPDTVRQFTRWESLR
ncbi:MAG TPA: proline dehydrogenase family protein [Candidatus Eisenbacteria bacterium]|nr:proline dehydrogenase family protein [Candidatus Eisenbacteria bacterium]